MPLEHDRLCELFIEACDLPAPERVRLLDERCAGDEALRAEVERLLEWDSTESGVLSEDDLTDSTALGDAPPPLPERVGRYTPVRLIGDGGMGIVWLATQEQPRRDVALKVIRPGVVAHDALARFELEVAALGRLRHPGIAQIYEAGTYDDGAGRRPFFAMEYVEGATLLEHARRLDVRERLAMFRRICDAVQHAHQRGIIHRDLKPANILVDHSARPKILDFGVARLTDSDVHLTRSQPSAEQLVGTLPYMSPEQVSGDASRPDTRTDVYSLGVVLYQLLTGELPYDFEGRSFASAARTIAERDPTPLASHGRVFRGDLSTIVLKALEKDPDRRYQSASDLAADVRRFLDHEPIVARPATPMYHASKFARRHVGLVAGLCAAALVLVVGTAGVAWQAARVQAEAHTRELVAEFLRELLTSIDPAKTGGEPLLLRDVLDDAAARLPERLADSPRVRADLHETIGETYHLLGENEAAERHLRAALAGYEDTYGPADDRALHAAGQLGYALRELDRLEEAEALLSSRLGFAGESLEPGAWSIRSNFAIVLDELGREDEARAQYRENLEHALRAFGPDSERTLRAQSNLGKHLLDQQQLDEALEHLEAVREGYGALHGDDHPATIGAIANLGGVRFDLGDHEGAELLAEAVERSERVLGARHLRTLRRRHNLVRAYWGLGDRDAAVAAAHELLQVCDRELGAWQAETLGALELTVTMVALNGDFESAEEVALEWHTRVSDELGTGHRSTGRIAFLLVNLYESWEKPEKEAHWRDQVGQSTFLPPNAP